MFFSFVIEKATLLCYSMCKAIKTEFAVYLALLIFLKII